MVGMARESFASDAPAVALDAVMNAYHVSIVANDPSADIAILKAAVKPGDINPGVAVTGLRSITPQRPLVAVGALIEESFPASGETLLLAGYPLDGEHFILQTGIATGLEIADFKPSQSVRPTDRLRIMLSLVSNPGNSGGPVFDSNGKVVGLLEGNLTAPLRDDRGQPLYYMRPKMDGVGRPLTDDAGKPILEQAPYLQNSGISLAVPARLLLRLAREKSIPLD
jgi:S1-C subfamily serine protease